MFLRRNRVWHFFPLWSQKSAWGQTLESDLFMKRRERCSEVGATLLCIHQLENFHVHSNMVARLSRSSMGMK